MSGQRGMYHLVANHDSDDGSDGDSDELALLGAGRRRRKRICMCIVCIVVLVVLLALGAAGYFAYDHFHKSKSCTVPGVCNSKILDYIDSSIDPCDDFYKYSCGKWLSANSLGDRDAWGRSYKLATDNYQHLDKYLSKRISENDPDVIRKSKYIYSACKNVTFIQNNFVKHVKDFIRKANGWDAIGIYPDDGWDINDDLVNDHYLGSSAFFSFGITPDDLDSTKAVIKVKQGGLTLDSPQKYYDRDGTDFQDLLNTIKQVLAAVDSTDSSDYSLLAKDIATYERHLAMESLTDAELRNVSEIYNPMTLEELSSLFNLDWVNYFNTIFSTAGVAFDFTSDTNVIVETPDYFRNINKYAYDVMYANFSINYARWHLLLSEFSYSTLPLNSGWDVVRKMKFPNTKLDEITKCAQMTEHIMPLAVARPFVKDFINDEIIDTVNETANQILEAFIERLMDKDWLDEETKDRCVDKVDSITRLIAYPDFIMMDDKLNQFYKGLIIDRSTNYFDIGVAVKKFQYHQAFTAYKQPIDKTQWPSAPTEVNAFYSPQSNLFVFEAGILRPPFIASDWPPFLLYGAFGTVIGHELSHGFDDQGQQYDEDGNRIQWWTDESVDNFEERTQCFVDQYSQYELQGYKIDGKLTLGENIADNGGVHTAYHAYKNVMNGIKHRSKKIGGHTLDQLFFVAFAQLWCTEYSDNTLKSLTQTDPHSPGPIRVLGSLVNNKEFATAFNCPKNSRMNPTNKCELW